MSPHTDDESAPSPLAALVVACLGAIPIVVLIALLAGLSWPAVAVLAAGTPTAMALLFAGALVVRRGRRTQQPVSAGVTLAETTASPAEARERRQALHDSARDVELQLAALRLGASGDEVDELFPLLSELHNLRLQLAETVLRGSGELPPTLQEQLVTEHRQFLTLLHEWRSRHGRRGGATG